MQSKGREREGKNKMVHRREMTVRHEGRGEVSGEKGVNHNSVSLSLTHLDT